MSEEKRTTYHRDYARAKAAERRAANGNPVDRPPPPARRGFDYVAWAAMDLYGLSPDECTREQETEVYRAAKAECIRQGDWPDRQKYVPPVECMRGHQHKGKAPCSSCALIEKQKEKRRQGALARERQKRNSRAA